MLSFFTILLVLIGANALFMVLSLMGIANGRKKPSESETKSSSKIYPISSTLASKIKKAV